MVGVPTHLSKFSRGCKDVGATIVIPRVALLEFENKQLRYAETVRGNLTSAMTILNAHRIQHQEANIEDLVKTPDILRILSSGGANVEVMDPPIDVFEKAQEKAARHLSPSLPNNKSDEMRDIIIWVIATKLANEEGGAILLSRDEIHIGSQGNEEARNMTLQRLRDFDDTLDFLGVETPAGRQVKELLVPVWSALIGAGISLEPTINIKRFLDIVFVKGESGFDRVSFKMAAFMEDGKLMEADVVIRTNDASTHLELSNIVIDKQDQRRDKIVIDQKYSTPVELDSDYDEKLRSLRKMIGGL